VRHRRAVANKALNASEVKCVVWVVTLVVNLHVDLQRRTERRRELPDVLDPIAVPQHEADLINAAICFNRLQQTPPFGYGSRNRLFVKNGMVEP
jgi:hypothetical protein